jgi:tRNA pseudouridine38-40 synthase
MPISSERGEAVNNYRLVIQYDGGRYKGWQRLGGEENTIQGRIEQVLSALFDHRIEINGCGRTDAGVHAKMQVANFKAQGHFEDDEIKRYLNRYLPLDIVVLDVARVPLHFHARLNAREKTYLYRIWNEADANPFERRYSWHIPEKLDLVAMNRGAGYLTGTHDFTAFSNAKSKTKSMVRIISSIEIQRDGGIVSLRIRGSGFLHNMVRRMTGTLADVGLGVVQAESIPGILLSLQRNRAETLAPACGLFLEYISYGSEADVFVTASQQHI